MAGVSKEQIEQAREFDLLYYLQTNEPHELIKTGANEYRLRSHNSLVISNGLWHWFSGDVGGRTALDFFIKVRGYGFIEAVETLCGLSSAHTLFIRPVKMCSSFTPVPLVLPEPNKNNDRVIAYLRSRGIDKDVIAACTRREDLYESAVNHNCVFIGRDKAGIRSYASLRGTFGNFKQDISGSCKLFGFKIKVLPSDPVLYVYESPIDALSAATLLKKDEEA